MAVILGINAYHGDSAACLFVDDRIVGAVEEERLNRVKHWAGLPVESVKWCLDAAGITLADVDHIAVNRNPNANLLRKVHYALTRRPDLSLLVNRFRNRGQVGSVAKGLELALGMSSSKAKFHFVEHHTAHIASTYYASPFDEAMVISVDAFGDFCSAAIGSARGTAIDIRKRVYFPHSLGAFYTAITQLLGFPYYGDEYKIMGLAPYGEPRFVPELETTLIPTTDGLFKLNLDHYIFGTSAFSYESKQSSPAVERMYSGAMEKLLGPVRPLDAPIEQRHKDIARSAQVQYENVFFHMLNSYLAEAPSKNIAVSGGCGYNSVANGKITLRSPIENVYVQAAAGDSGGAIGAAYKVWHEINPGKRGPRMDHAYWGPRFSDAQLKAAIDLEFAEKVPAGIEVSYAMDDGPLIRETAQAVADGKVVGWFQGAVEWGPRALGNRSIVCDPRRADMKDILNQKIKRRESFRPFAPSILREDVPEWFETNGNVPFMMQVYQVRSDKRQLIPAVTHVDGSGRLQTVTAEINDKYYRLISEFKRLTNIPCVLNTSFNENEPIVCQPKEALDCFLRTKMDLLVLGPHLIRRHA